MLLPAPRTALCVRLPAASGASQLHTHDAELCPAPQNNVNEPRRNPYPELRCEMGHGKNEACPRGPSRNAVI